MVEMFHVRMREGETVAAFANRFRGMLPMSIEADNKLAKFWFLNKLPSELRTREAVQIFEDGGTFKDLMKECHAAYQQALSDRSNKRFRAQVNSVQDNDKEAEQAEEEPDAVNLVNGDESQQWKSKRARTDQGTNLAPDAKVFAAVCQPHQRFGTKAWRCLGNGCPFEKMPGFTTKRPPRGRGQGNGRGRVRN